MDGLQDDTRQIKVGKQSIGIIGLTHVIEEVAENFAKKPESEIQAELLNRLSKSNYIPDGMEYSYGKAFLKEFNKYLGKPYEEEKSEVLEIKVLGPGCPKCKQTEEIVRQVVTETGVDANVEKVSDLMKIAGYGVFGTPAVVVDGEVKSVGKVPTKEEIKAWIGK